jgi:serine protease Do
MANHRKNIIFRMSATKLALACTKRGPLTAFIHCLILCSAFTISLADAFSRSREISDKDAEPGLVRVHVIAEIQGPADALTINGMVVRGYSPKISQAFSSTGIVLDNKGSIMTFLGYRWVGVQGWDPRFEIATTDGQRLKGKLIGIDQGNGVAVIRALSGALIKTAVCARCEIKDGATVMTPVFGNPSLMQLREAQVLSIAMNPGMQEPTGWMMKVSRPFPDIGQPILTTDNRVLGFIASQDPMGIQTVVYPISELLSSAEKIIKANGDIRAGWLGVLLADSSTAPDSGILIRQVEPESPAERAGLSAWDRLLNYNGRRIKDIRQFIRLVQDTPLGSRAKLEIEREGNPVTVTARIEARKPQKPWEGLSLNLPGTFGSPFAGMMAEPEPPSPKALMGLDIIALNPALADAFQMPMQTGLLVVNVAKRMPADLSGILAGDVIVAVDGRNFADASGFANYLQTRGRGSQLTVKVSRKGVERALEVRLPK